MSIAMAASQPAPSATVDGVVVDDLGRLVSKARVALLDSKWAIVRLASTDASGKFLISQLPAGSFRLAVSKGGYADTMLGEFRPGAQGAVLSLTDNSHRSVKVRLPRGAVISGTTRDSEGGPLSGTSIRVMRWATRDGARNLEPVAGSLQTNSRGEYRVYGLPAGTYFVAATSPLTYTGELRRGGEGNDASLIVPPIYYPGAVSVGSATALTLAAGDELDGIDFRLTPVPSGRVEGRVIYPAGQQFTPQRVELIPAAGRDQYISALSTTAANDGRFSFRGVPTGRYTAVTAGRPRSASYESGMFWGSTEVLATPGADAPPEVTLNLEPGAILVGKYAFDGQTATPNVQSVRIDVLPRDGPFSSQSRGQIPFLQGPDGTFRITGIPPGVYSLSGRSVPAPWFLLSAISAGRDMLDMPIEVRSAQAIDDLVVTFTDRAPELSGLVTGPDGRPAFECAVLVFPVDRRYWTPHSRRVRIAPPNVDGRYAINDLPPGEYHVTATAEPLESGEPSSAVLDSLQRTSSRVTLTLGGKISQNLTLRTPRLSEISLSVFQPFSLLAF
jgi:hypothetical protein